MKRMMICGFLGLIGTAWTAMLGAYVQENLLTSWSGSRFWASAAELGVAVPLVLVLVLLAGSVILLLAGLFTKD